MSKSFAGFSPKAVTFLRQLKKNNSRDWFQPRKPQFEELLRQPMLELTGLVADQMRGFAVDYVTDPVKAMRRIYRDVRFSKDKSPYKTNISAMFWRTGLPKVMTAGFYFSLTPEGVDIAGGLYMPSPAELLAIRKQIAKNPLRFLKLLNSQPLRSLMGFCQGEKMIRDPRGFEDADGRAIDLLRYKQFYFQKTLDVQSASKPGLDKEITKLFKTMAPFIQSLNQIFLNEIQETTDQPSRPIRPKAMF